MLDEKRSFANLTECMQEAIYKWEGGLKTTGGALVPNKTWTYPISFKFNSKGEASYKTLHEMNLSFTVPNKDDTIEPLTCHKLTKGKETLRVVLAPDGNNHDAYENLQLKAQRW